MATKESHPAMADAEYTWVQPEGPPVPLNFDILTKKKMVMDQMQLKLTNVEKMDEYLSPSEGNSAKVPCKACGKTRNNRLFCYDCLIPLEGIELPQPDVLPVKLVVIRHPSEKRSKSSSLHAQVLAGKEQAETFETPLPESLIFNKNTACVIFPGENSTSVSDLPNLSSLKTVVVLDSQWSKAKGLNRLPQLEGLPRVHLKEYKTFFWRYQRFPDTYLATIEAIYFFYVEFFEASRTLGFETSLSQEDRDSTIEQRSIKRSKSTVPYDGRFDNLLAIYAAQFRKIFNQEVEYVNIKQEKEKLAVEKETETTTK